MKLLIACILLFCFPIYALEIGEDHTDKTPIEELYKLSELMHDLEGKLREDRVDTTVIVEGKEIDDRLEKLIKEVENSKKQNNPSTKETKQHLEPSGKNPLTISKLPQKQFAEDKIPHIRPSAEIAKGNWSNLPKSQREELFQVWGTDMPTKWKSRLEAYFISISAEEAEWEKNNSTR